MSCGRYGYTGSVRTLASWRVIWRDARYHALRVRIVRFVSLCLMAEQHSLPPSTCAAEKDVIYSFSWADFVERAMKALPQYRCYHFSLSGRHCTELNKREAQRFVEAYYDTSDFQLMRKNVWLKAVTKPDLSTSWSVKYCRMDDKAEIQSGAIELLADQAMNLVAEHLSGQLPLEQLQPYAVLRTKRYHLDEFCYIDVCKPGENNPTDPFLVCVATYSIPLNAALPESSCDWQRGTSPARSKILQVLERVMPSRFETLPDKRPEPTSTQRDSHSEG